MLSWPSGSQVVGVRSAGIVLAMLSVVVGTVYFGQVIRAPLTASQLDAVLPSSDPAASETVYPEPRPIVWIAVVEGVLAGGEGLVMRRTDAEGRFQAYIVPGASISVPEGPVRVTGVQTGISCAYASLFGGQCVPSVDIGSLEPVPIMLVQ